MDNIHHETKKYNISRGSFGTSKATPMSRNGAIIMGNLPLKTT